MSKRALTVPKKALTIVALAIVTLFVAATLALPHRPAPVAAADGQLQRLHQSSDVALAAQPVALPSAPTAVGAAVAPVVAPPAVSELPEKTRLSKAEKDQIADAPTPAAAVNAISDALGELSVRSRP
jgi:hypothetical protein